MTRLLAALLVLAPVSEGQAQQTPADDVVAEQASETEQGADEQSSSRIDVVVVTASRREEQLINAPATMTVLTAEMIESSPGHNVADLFRTVPGLNIAQTAARDFNLNTRAATGTLSDSHLAVIDGRSVYQDFFGFVLWDLIPVNTNEIKQIEIIRGPASAVWGANAMNGVVNVITKTPREMLGTTVHLGLGQFGRSLTGEDYSSGGLFRTHVTHAGAPNDRFAYKFSAALLTQEALPRPAGTVPGTGAAYPSYTNRGTTQPRFDARVDYDSPDGRHGLIVSGGVAGTDGIIHSGLGPFDIQPGSRLTHGKVNYRRGELQAQFFVNAFTGDAPALLQKTGDGSVLPFTVETLAYGVSFSNAHIVGAQHLLSYGGNFRHTGFDLSLAPDGTSRDEGGLYIQDEIFLSDRFRWVVGTRVDRFDILDKSVFSPRTTFMFKPRSDHTLRLSFNRAFRAPHFVNSFLDASLGIQIGGGIIPVPTVGNLDLKEEALTAYEAGYIGDLGPTTVSAAVYLNHTDDMILFAPVANALGLPVKFTYLNSPRVRDRGVELAVDWTIRDDVASFVNYSWQAETHATELDEGELNIAPRHRFNAGIRFTRGRYFGNVSMNFVDKAFWQDVLNTPFHGWTDAYSLVNGGFGVRSSDGQLTASLQATNLFNKGVPLRDRCSFGRLPWLISQALSVTYMAGERRLYLERNCRLPESPAHSRRRNREGPASSKGLNSQRGFGPAVEPRRKSRPRSTSLHGSSPCKC